MKSFSGVEKPRSIDRPLASDCHARVCLYDHLLKLTLKFFLKFWFTLSTTVTLNWSFNGKIRVFRTRIKGQNYNFTCCFVWVWN